MSKKDRLLNLLACAVFGLLGGIVSGSGLVSVKSADQYSEVLKAKRLEIVNSDGRVQASIYTQEEHGARLDFYTLRGYRDPATEAIDSLSLGWVPSTNRDREGHYITSFEPRIEIYGKDRNKVWSAH